MSNKRLKSLSSRFRLDDLIQRCFEMLLVKVMKIKTMLSVIRNSFD